MKCHSRLVYLLVGTIAAVKKSKAEEDNRSTLVSSKYHDLTPFFLSLFFVETNDSIMISHQ